MCELRVLTAVSVFRAGLSCHIVERASPLFQAALPVLQAAKDNVESFLSPRKARPELPLSAPPSTRASKAPAKFNDADAAVYAAMHKVTPLVSPRIVPPRLGGATAPRTGRMRAPSRGSPSIDVESPKCRPTASAASPLAGVPPAAPFVAT